MLVVVTGNMQSVAGRSRKLRTLRMLAVAASQKGLRLVVVTPDAPVRLGTSRTSGQPRLSLVGYEYEEKKQAFVKKNLSLIPSKIVVFDAMYLADLKQHRDTYRSLIQRLRRLHVPTFNPIMQRKDDVYRALMGQDISPGRLPKTWFHMTESAFRALLREHSKLWFKPVLGSGGRNMAFVRDLGKGRYRVVADRFWNERIRTVLTTSQLTARLRSALRRRAYFAQENIALLQTEDRRKVDFRVTVARTEEGDWEAIGVTARYGAAGSRLTNFHAGGRVESLTNLTPQKLESLQKLGLSPKDLRRAKETSVKVARVLAHHYPTLGLLGVDVGFTRDKDLFIYDCNGRPGRDILTDAEVDDLMKHVAGFATYLQSKS